ncbi:hypothetical protein EJ07DRAFT_157671 [Lizonia empirigonia]|nr:hypothetical protein EJ07DRAFT_157671 [Lizonia empirigonia]
MPPANENCVCCNVPLTEHNRPTPAMIERFWASHNGPCNAWIIASLEEYLERVTEDEEVEAGLRYAQQDTATVKKSDHLTVFQVRGFIREILTHRNRPREAARILRVLRRLKTRWISETVLFDTGIELAVALLRDHPSGDVQSMARAVLVEWLNQYPTVECTASSTHAEDSQNASPASGNLQMALMQDSVDTASKDVSFVTAGERSDPTDNAKFLPIASNDRRNLLADRLMSLVREEMIASIANPPNCVHPDSHNAEIEPDPIAGVLDPVYKHVKDVQYLKTVMRTSEDFLSTSKSYLSLDDRAMDLLANALCASYDGAIRTIELAAATTARKFTLEVNLNGTRAQIHTNTVEITNTGHDEEVEGIFPASQQTLLQQRMNLEETLQEQTSELEKVVGIHEGLQSELLMNILRPLKVLSDVVSRPTAEGESRTMGSHVSDLKESDHTIQKLQKKLKLSAANLSAAQEQLKSLQSGTDALKIQLELAQTVNMKMKKDIERERASSYSKYYRDIEIQVKERVQQEKMKTTARLCKIEAKAQQHDTSKAETLELQKQLRDLTCKIDVHIAARAELEDQYRKLKEKEEATQQGYDQMRQDKHEAETRAATVEADLCTLRTELNVLQATLACNETACKESEQTTGSQGANSSTIKILTHSKQLTEADRLDMIANKWKSDLRLAETELQRKETALKDTNTEIATVLHQLIGLRAPKARRTGRAQNKASLSTTEKTAAVLVDSRLNVRSDDPDANGAAHAIASPAPWTRVDEQLRRFNSTTPQILRILPQVGMFLGRSLGYVQGKLTSKKGDYSVFALLPVEWYKDLKDGLAILFFICNMFICSQFYNRRSQDHNKNTTNNNNEPDPSLEFGRNEVKASLNIDTPPICEPDAAAADTILESAPAGNFKRDVALGQDDISSVGLEEDDPTAGPVNDTGMNFGMQVDTVCMRKTQPQ